MSKSISLILRHGWQPQVTEKQFRNAQVVPVLYSRNCRFWTPTSRHGAEAKPGVGLSQGHASTTPLLPIGLALAYCDARVRKEGLDLQLMMAALGEAGSVVRPWERAEDTLGGGMLVTTELRALNLR